MALVSESVPTFAIVGAVNHGKSSVVSALAENDEVRISSMPGETVSCQRFWLRDLFAFYDTPGFQNAIEALRELEPAGRASEPLEVFRSFLKRHQDKLFFGSDCSCADGHGAGVSQNNNPAASRLAGKCVARETLGLLKRSSSPEVFQKIVWGNVHKLLRIPA